MDEIVIKIEEKNGRWNYFVVRDEIDCLSYGIGFPTKEKAEFYARQSLTRQFDNDIPSF